MIVSVRGTSGSGKSTLVQKLIADRTPIFELGKLVGYQCKNFRVLGPYPADLTLAAGVDILNHDSRKRDVLFDQIIRWAGLGHVLYEGLLISNEVGRTVQIAQTFPTTVIFLTTPLDVCLDRINARRRFKTSAGWLFGEEPVSVSPKKTTEKFYELQRVAERLSGFGVKVEQLDCDAALARCRELLKL
jgi:hypothetical protein